MPVRHHLLILCALAGALSATTLPAAETLPPASERFAKAGATEVPDFQQHVAPLLGRLGCNGRACHGSFQGQGGMRLSLFGYDFQMDYAGLTGKATSEDDSRIDPKNPRDSLILRKPTLNTDHKGGERFKTSSWEHRLLLKWIDSRKGVTEPRELQTLQVEPSEVVFGKEGASQPLRIIACWKDGSREDVTPLCRFRTNNDAIVTVDRDGLLKSTGPGDTHVVVFYDNGVKAVPVMRAVSVLAEARYPAQPTATRIDQFVLTKLQKLGIVPASLCSDAEFLRRVSIDLTGTLPTPDEVEKFLADPAADKRSRMIDQLLERPAYAAWWANKLCDFTGCNPNAQADNIGQDVSVQWYMWIYSRVRDNIRYDELVKGIVLALGRREGQSYDDYAAEMSSYYRDDSPADFAQRETMPHFWTRSSVDKPEEKALAFAHSFLGLQLQCAQCHKHPFDSWTQSDFKQLAELFSSLRYDVPADDEARFGELSKQVGGLAMSGFYKRKIRPDNLRYARAGGTLPWQELINAERSGPAKLSLLRSRVIELAAKDDPRPPVLQWMLEPGNPWFSRAFVNRVWAGYFTVGIVDPPDDLNPANPPSNPELLDWLAASFVENGYNMKWLHRQIVSSDAYQRSWRPNDTNRDDRRNFSRAIPRRIPAEVAYDALKQVLVASDRSHEVQNDLTRRAIGHSSMRFAGTYAMQVFGKPDRAINCDCERNNQPSLLQAIFQHNDPLIQQNLDESGWLREIASAEQTGTKLDRQALIREAWLRTFSRPPQPAEVDRAEKHFEQAASLSAGLRDLLWALINAKEFILNH